MPLLPGYTPNELLLSLFSKGLFVFNKSTGTLKPLVIDNEEINNLLRYSGKTVNVCQVSSGSVLLLGSHIYRYDIASGKVEAAIEEEGNDLVGTILPVAHEAEVSYFCDLRRIYVLNHSTNRLHTVYTCGRDTLINAVSRTNVVFFGLAATRG